MQYRVEIRVRRKGTNHLWGKEFKVEDYDDMDDLFDAAQHRVTVAIEEDEEYVFRNEGNNEQSG